MFDQLTIDDREEDVRLRAVWTQVIEEVSLLVPPKMAERFLQSLAPSSFKHGQVTLETPSSFNSEWIRNRCLSDLQQSLTDHLGEPIVVNVVVSAKPRTLSTPSTASVRVATQTLVDRPTQGGFIPSPKYRFDTFIQGPSNRLALAGARAVAREPGSKFNPLFIYGPSGLGKTHLLHAIANELRISDPKSQVAYLTAAQFTEDFVQAMQANRIDHFRRAQRNVHVWLVDDIQFIAGKDRTQEEIFYIFNALQQTGRQIVLCSDRPPRELYLMDERLRSRFESGLVADIQSPDTETRCAILQSKAEQEGVPLPLELAMYLAENVSGNVRVLEGALIKIIAQSSVSGREIELELIREIVEQHYSTPIRSRPTVPQILDLVSKHFNIPVEDIRGESRKAPIVNARHVAVFLTREVTGDSWKHIGGQFGKRDHTSMMHAYQKVSEMIAHDREFANRVKALRRNLQGD